MRPRRSTIVEESKPDFVMLKSVRKRKVDTANAVGDTLCGAEAPRGQVRRRVADSMYRQLLCS